MAFSIPNLPHFLAKCVFAMQRQRHETVCRLLCTASLSIRNSMSRTAEPFIRLEIEDGWERLLSVERHRSEGSVIPQHKQKPPLFPHARREAMLRVPRVRQRNTPRHVEWVGGQEFVHHRRTGEPCRRGSVAKFDFWAKSKNWMSGIQ